MAENFTPKEIQDIIDEYTHNLANGIPISAELNAAMKDAAAGVKDYTRSLKASKEALFGSLKNLGMALVNGEHGAAIYNDAIEKGAKTFSAWNKGAKNGSNFLGKTAEVGAKLENAMAKQADALFESYQSISRSGIALGMDDAFRNLEAAGYTMKEIGQYGQLMKENATVLSTLGGTTADGAKKFAQASKNINNSGLDTQFKRMGMTVDTINSGIINYVKYQQMSGSIIQQDDKQIAASAADFIVQQDKLTKLTGKSADEQNKIYESALAQEQYAAHTYDLQQKIAKGGAEGEDAQAQLAFEKASLIEAQKIGPEFFKITSMKFAGAVNTKAFQVGQRAYSQYFAELDSGRRDVGRAVNIANKEGKDLAAAQSRAYALGYGESVWGPMSEKLMQTSASLVDHTKAEKTATTQIKDQAKGTDPLVKNMVKLTQDQRDITQSTDHGIKLGVKTTTSVLADLTSVTSELTGVFGQMAGKEGKIGGGPTLIDRAKNLFGFGPAAAPPATAPSAPASGAPKPLSPPTGSGPPTTGANAADLINFTGGTGDKSHFDQLNPSVASSFMQMANEYFNTTGKKLQVNSAYRSPGEQASVNSGNNPKAAPGKSLHNIGKALDINSSQVSELQSNGLLGKFGFSPLPGDPPHIQMPSAATGGILSGPKSGFQAMLHGNEAVVPLPDGKTIPVQMKGAGGSSQGQIKLLAMELDKLESMLRVMNKQNDITSKILQMQS